MSDHATALVVDDEKPIRKFLRIVLEEDHYRVLESESGKQGLADVAFRTAGCCFTRSWTSGHGRNCGFETAA
jgi:DNA-binding NtrC family response regulator